LYFILTSIFIKINTKATHTKAAVELKSSRAIAGSFLKKNAEVPEYI